MYRLKEIGKVKTKKASEIASSRHGIGFEKLDRDAFDPEKAYDKMSEIGIKWVRIQLAGRAENLLDNIRFSDCTFEVTDYSEFNNKKYHGAQGVEQSYGGYPKIAYCDRVRFDNVEFQVKN